MKLKLDVVGEMDHLIRDILQYQFSLDKLRREYELKDVLD
jgi:hypothetical protein